METKGKIMVMRKKSQMREKLRGKKRLIIILKKDFEYKKKYIEKKKLYIHFFG